MCVGDGVPEREPAGQLGSRGLAPSQQELQAQEPKPVSFRHVNFCWGDKI